jgi:hypothetical protein
MATKKKKETIKEVVIPKKVQTKPYTVVKAAYGFKIGQVIRLNEDGVKFYKKNQVIK